nr:MAG TPA: hypothetical protein [Siphoviridae sp. ctMq01]
MSFFTPSPHLLDLPLTTLSIIKDILKVNKNLGLLRVLFR